jgi:hypothetical protein
MMKAAGFLEPTPASVKRLELAPRHVRKTQAEWLAMARQTLKV